MLKYYELSINDISILFSGFEKGCVCVHSTILFSFLWIKIFFSDNNNDDNETMKAD